MKTLIKVTIITSLVIIIISGANNSVQMNSVSFMSEQNSSVKTLSELTDEMSVAQNMGDYTIEQEQKFVQESKPAKITYSVNTKRRREAVQQKEVTQTAYIQEEIRLEIVEYFNPKNYDAKVLKADQDELPVSGVLEASNGVVEKIDVTLPDGESIFVEYAPMNQNMFKFSNSEGREYRGIMYKIDAVTYMVSLSEGPHAGTRMKFKNTEDDSGLYEPSAEIADAGELAQENGFVF